MGDKTVEEYKNELVGAWILAGLGRGTRAGLFTGLALEALAVFFTTNADQLDTTRMVTFLALTTGIGAALGAAKGLYVGTEKKAHFIEQAIRNKPEMK